MILKNQNELYIYYDYNTFLIKYMLLIKYIIIGFYQELTVFGLGATNGLLISRKSFIEPS